MKQPDKILNIDVTQPVEINSQTDKHNMTLYEAARWCALLQGLDVITKKANHLNSKDIPDVLVQAYRENLKLKRKLGLVPTIGTKGQ